MDARVRCRTGLVRPPTQSDACAPAFRNAIIIPPEACRDLESTIQFNLFAEVGRLCQAGYGLTAIY